MTITFFLVAHPRDEVIARARLMVESARRACPGVTLVQLSDASTIQTETETVIRIDRVWDGTRSAAVLLDLRLELYARAERQMPHVDLVFADSDILFQRDVREVFAVPGWHVGLTDRAYQHVTYSADFLARCPWNTGVVFVPANSPRRFWHHVSRAWRALQPAEQDWLSEQRVVAEIARDPSLVVRALPGDIYNFPPDASHPGAHAALLHFKGPRKRQMLASAALVTPWPTGIEDHRELVEVQQRLRTLIVLQRTDAEQQEMVRLTDILRARPVLGAR
jgi:hypothetical protein